MVIFDTALVHDCKTLLSENSDYEEVLRLLRARGASKIQSIKMLADLGAAPSGELKLIVHNSEAWSDVFERDSRFHDSVVSSEELPGKNG